jgi:RHS repeat-associated protein
MTEEARAPMRVFRAAAAGLAAGLLALGTPAPAAQAAVHAYEVLLDLDADASTGCSATTARGDVSGIERVIRLEVTTGTGAQVSALASLECAGGTSFGAPAALAGTPYALVLGRGSGGTTAIETQIALASIPAPADGTRATVIRLATRSRAADGSADALVPPVALTVRAAKATPRAIPTLDAWALAGLIGLLAAAGVGWLRSAPPARRGSPLGLLLGAGWGLAVLALGSGLVVAITRDGLVADWAGVAALSSGARGDAVGPGPAGSADLVALFAKVDGQALALRVDAALALEAGNQPPQVSAGPNQSITLPASAMLSGSATDDGLPNPPAALTLAWTKVSGPGTVTFGNPASAATTASFGAAGVYVLRLTADDGALTASADVTITVNPAGSVSGPSIAAVPDRTVEVGTRYQQLLQATHPNLDETLAFSLPAAPPGASLAPAPLVDWTPTGAQLGVHDFTAQVTDGGGRSASASFRVTVVRTNLAPQLAVQPDATLAIGTPFARALAAVDPNGDALTFQLLSGPPGMTLTGANLSWSTGGRAAGEYLVSVRVTDAGGLADTRSFRIVLVAGVPPLARDDRYQVKVGESLVVAAPGVLGNDEDPLGQALAAVRLTAPDKGTLAAFDPDGSFSYQAPAALPPRPPLAAALAWHADTTFFSYAMAIGDLDGDGTADVVHLAPNHHIRALRGRDGSVLWAYNGLPAPYNDCIAMAGDGNQPVVADVDDDGAVEVVMHVGCIRDWPQTGSAYYGHARVIALAGATGAVKWLSPHLLDITPVAGNLPPFAVAEAATMHVARLAGSETPSILGGYTGENFSSDPTCPWIPGSAATDRRCRYVYALDGADGSLRRTFYATPPHGATPPAFGYNRPGPNGTGRFEAPLVVDLDGDGSLEVVYEGTIWSAAGALLRHLDGIPARPNSARIAIADLDANGSLDVVTVDLMSRRMRAFDPGGTLLWDVPAPHCSHDHNPSTSCAPTIADVDGDGAPDIVLAGGSRVAVHDRYGRLRWVQQFPLLAFVSVLGCDNRPAVYDLDGDGSPEVVVRTLQDVLFLKGADGSELASHNLSATIYNYTCSGPTNEVRIVDIDNDGAAEVVVYNQASGGEAVGGVLALRSANDPWMAAREAYPFWGYHVTAIGDDLSVPVVYARPNASAATNLYGQQQQLATRPDLRTREQTQFTYRAAAGGRDSVPATVHVDILPQNRPPVFTSIPPTAAGTANFAYALAAYDPDPGDTVTFSLVYADNISGAAAATLGADNVLRKATSYSGPHLFTVRATDSQGASTDQSFLVEISSATASVPALTGLTQPAAQAALAGAGLLVGAIDAQHDAAPAGQVIGQSPGAGTSVPRGASVAIVVSLGPQPVPVPYLVGQTLASATDLLRGLGFTVVVVPAPSATVPPGQVTAQAPAIDTLLVPGPANPVTLTVSSGSVPAGTITSILVEPGPTTRLVGESVAYRATAVYSDGTSANVTLNALWSSGAPAVAGVDAVGTATALAAGSATISATVAGLTGQATLTVAAPAGDVTAPVAQIAAPADGADVAARVAVTGTATDASFLRYELAIAPAGSSDWRLLAEGTSPVAGGTLGELDPTLLVNDLYTLRLRVYDRGGNLAEAERSVQVRGARKVGLFTLTFQDLNVDLTGLPITVNRTYDSRDRTQGDFGYGWRLGFQTLRLRTNRVLGTGWLRQQSGISSTLLATAPHRVSVTLPDGRVEDFDMQLAPTSGVGVLYATRVTGFAPRSGTQGTLEVLGNTDLLVLNAGAGEELVDDATLDTYDPKLFRYTTPDGTAIEIHRSEGVRKITDRNGHSLTFGPGGIVHSGGQSVVFTRDAAGRITAITDPAGRSQAYAYDANGDLVRHTDATGAGSTYAYDRHHAMIEMRNALGVRMTRNEYDAQGRLVRMIDAAGNPIEIAHDDAANEQRITDRRGNVTRLVYDAQGNVTRVERTVTIEGVAVPAVTTSTYDALGNETSTIDPDGRRVDSTYTGLLPLTHRVDPAGLDLATSFVYNARNDPTQATDPGGRVFGFTYDAAGNVTGATIPNSGGTSVTNNAAGQPVESVDASGTRIVLARDANGRVSREETYAGGTLLRRIEMTWDAAGNKTSETLHRTIGGVLTPLTTAYAYDAANRLTAVTDPLGGVRRTEYDAAGRITATVDPLGRRTTFTYDVLGRRVRTDHPDGAFETAAYDVDGNLVAQTDRAGRATTHVYDELNRRVRTVAPDGAVTQTVYTPGGKVAATIDARGNRTDHAYDAAGRAIAITLPPVPDGSGGPPTRPAVTQALNALGQPTSRTDPLGRVTTFQYDAEGRLVRTTHPDGAFTTQTWDARGRRTSLTNEEGQTTSFTYDGLGRLIGVAGHAGTMICAYDEAGNVVRQTDALGRVTTFAYDALDRLVERQYPGGETERWTWDAAGNLIARTDGLGRVTSIAHDAMDRPTVRTLPGGVSIATTYHADGRRAAVTDARGVTRFDYDEVGRLASVTHPTGEVVSYAYDANGNLASLSTPAATLAYAYDALDRLTQVTAPEGATTQAYDLAGNRVRRTLANGIVSEVVYDTRNRPTALAHRLGAATLQSYTTTWSPANRRTSLTEADGSVETYGYDSLGRLVQETRTGVAPHAISHLYDAAGNRTQTVRNGVTTAFAYDSNDRLSSDGAATFVWDANGNLVTRAQGASVTTYTWDAENRLVGIAGPGVSSQYVYDADGNRVQASGAGGTTRFLVSRNNPTGLSQVLEERDAATNALAVRYTAGSELLSMTRGGATSTLLADPMGSVRALASSAGAITDTYRYDAYGNALASAGGSVNPLRWRGERLEESGLYDLRARRYSPALGRFLSRDPFVGRGEVPASLHRYLYANADPVNHEDPTGQETLISLVAAQSIDTVLEGIDKAVKANQVCNGFATIAALGYVSIGTQLAVGFATEFLGLSGAKSSISIAAFNPAALKRDDIKKVDFRLEGKLAKADSLAGYSAKLAFGFKDGNSQSVTFDKDGFSVGTSGPVKVFGKALKKEIKKCETFVVGSIQLKQSTSNWLGLPSLTVLPGLAVEVEFLNLIRNEWKLFDGISFGIRELALPAQ